MSDTAPRPLGLRRVALTALSVALVGHAVLTDAATPSQEIPVDLERATVAELQAAMGAGTLTSELLVQGYQARIRSASSRRRPSTRRCSETY